MNHLRVFTPSVPFKYAFFYTIFVFSSSSISFFILNGIKTSSISSLMSTIVTTMFFTSFLLSIVRWSTFSTSLLTPTVDKFLFLIPFCSFSKKDWNFYNAHFNGCDMLRRTTNIYSRIIVLNEIMFLLCCCNWFLVGKMHWIMGGNVTNEFLLFLCPWNPRLILSFMCIRSKTCNHIIVVYYHVEPPLLNQKNLKTNHKWGWFWNVPF